jgi:hypothetical protein
MLVRYFLTFLALISVAGCVALGAMTDPVTREFRAPPNSGDRTFTAIVRKISEGGTILATDRADGYINARTSMQIQVSINIGRDGVVKIKGQLPWDKFLMGTTVEREMDKLVATLSEAVR